MIKRKKLVALSEEQRADVERLLPDVYRILSRHIYWHSKYTRALVEDVEQAIAFAVCRAFSLWRENKGRSKLSYAVMAGRSIMREERKSFDRRKALRSAGEVHDYLVVDHRHNVDPDAALDASTLLAHASPAQRQALVAHVMDGETTYEIAEREGTTHQNVSYHVKAGLKRIREKSGL